MDYVIAPELAEEELKAMEEEFGAVSTIEKRAVLLDAIKRGLIDFNPEIPSVTYHLQKPVLMDKGEKLEKITLHEPVFSEIDRINKSLTVQADKSGNFIADATLELRLIARTIIVLGDISTGTMDKISRRDFGVLAAVTDFFG